MSLSTSNAAAGRVNSIASVTERKRIRESGRLIKKPTTEVRRSAIDRGLCGEYELLDVAALDANMGSIHRGGNRDVAKGKGNLYPEGVTGPGPEDHQTGRHGYKVGGESREEPIGDRLQRSTGLDSPRTGTPGDRGADVVCGYRVYLAQS